MVDLTKEERLKYCDLHFYKLVKILMLNDALAYVFIYDPHNNKEKFTQDITDNNQKMFSEYRNHHTPTT